MKAERKATMGGLGNNFIWAADKQENLKESLCVDAFHDMAPMSKRLAAKIASAIEERNLITAKKAD